MKDNLAAGRSLIVYAGSSKCLIVHAGSSKCEARLWARLVWYSAQWQCSTAPGLLPPSPLIFGAPSRKVKGRVIADLGSHEIVSSRGNKSRAAMFTLLVAEVLDDWPEKHRKRKLVRADDPKALLLYSLVSLRKEAPPREGERGGGGASVACRP